MINSPVSQENPDNRSGALANIIQLARLSRLTLLYHGSAATAGDAGREQAAALASAATAVADGDVVVVFDAGSDLAVPDLLTAIEAAVLETVPQAPLAPPMAGPVDALAFWQQALGLRFLLIMQRLDLALSPPDPEFDEVLLKLAHDPLDISVLLLMDEAAAPLLQRLKDVLPELGETFLRLPEPANTEALPQDEPALADAPTLLQPAKAVVDDVAAVPAALSTPDEPPPRFGPSPFVFDDPAEEVPAQAIQPVQERTKIELPTHLQPDEERQAPREDRRRSRRFSSLLEEAGIAPAASDPVVRPVVEPAAEPVTPAEATFAPFTPPAEAPTAALPTAAPIVPGPAAVSPAIFPDAVPPTVAAFTQALPDGRAEPSLQAPPPRSAAPATGARIYRERRPMQVAAWMQKRRGRRRRDTVGIASRVGSSSTVVFVLLAILAVLGWQMPQLGQPAGASPRGAAARPAAVAAKSSRAIAVRGNRHRLSIGTISTAASSAGTGRDALGILSARGREGS